MKKTTKTTINYCMLLHIEIRITAFDKHSHHYKSQIHICNDNVYKCSKI